MAVFESEGIVLKQFDLGEADKIITFYTKNKGKVRAVARGVRKSKSSISGLVLPFSYNYVTFYRGRSLDRINQIENKYSFSRLREDLKLMAYASFIAEIVEKVGMEDHPEEALFSLLLSTFYRLIKSKEFNLKYRELSFKIRLLGILGFRPELYKCSLCSRETKVSYINCFSTSQGSIICEECINETVDEKQKLSGETLQVLRNFFKGDVQKISKIKISQRTFKEIDNLINKFMFYHLDIKLKSYDFLNTIKALG